MPDDIILRPQGRVSEPSADAAPPGSMLEAHNVVIREEGVVRYIGEIDNISVGSMSNTAWVISPQFDNGTAPAHLIHGGSNTDPAGNQGVRSTALAGTEIQYTDVDGVATSIEAYDHGSGLTYYPMYIARDNLYLSDQRGVYKWTDTDASSLDRVWDSQAANAFVAATGSGTWLANNSHVQYLMVLMFEDSNGVIRRTAPSGRGYVENTSGSAKSVDVTAYIPADAYDSASFVGVEVYRTRSFANTVSLPGSYFLVGSIPKSLFDTELGESRYNSVAYEDDVSDTELGASLYTNDGLANYAPPEHLYHASFRGHEFWGDVAEKEFFPELRSTTSSTGEHTHTLTGASYTLGSPTITESGSLAGLEVGMSFVGGSSFFPPGTYVTAITGTGPWTITVSEDSLITSTANISFRDAVYILWGDGATTRFPLPDLLPLTDLSGSSLVEVINPGGTLYGDDSRFYFTYTFASRHRSARQGVAQMWVSNPELFEAESDWADLNTGSGSPTTGGTEALQALHRARIYWSKHQEPEHTTLANFQDIGNASGIGGGAIVGLGALKDALIIIKQDGVFRLTGDRGNWRTDPLQTSGLRFLGGRSTQVLNDAVITLTNRGLVRITAQGVQSLTDGIVNDWFEEDGHDSTPRLPEVESYILRNDGYTPALLQSAVDHRHQEYYILCEGTDSEILDGVAGEVLIYNAKTGSFTTWAPFDKVSALGYSRGDILSTSSAQRPSVAFSDDGTIYILDNDPEVATDSGKPIIKFRALSEGDPTHVKLWTDAVWQMVPKGTRANVECTFAASEDEATTSVAIADDAGTRQIRCWVPRATARSEELVLGITGDQLAIRGVRVSFRSSGRRSPVSND